MFTSTLLQCKMEYETKNCKSPSNFRPKRSITLDYVEEEDGQGQAGAGGVNLILQSMSAWYVYFSVGVNSRRHVRLEPCSGLLAPAGRATVRVVATGECFFGWKR